MFPLNFIYLPNVLFIIVVIVITVIALRVHRSRLDKARKRLKRLAEELGGELEKDIIQGLYKDDTYICRYYHGRKSHPSSLTVIIKRPFPEDLVIRRKKWFDRLSRSIGLISEVKTGDAAFDNTFFVEAENTPSISTYMSNSGIRNTIASLFSTNMGTEKVTLSEMGHELIMRPFSFDNSDQLRIPEILEKLKAIPGDVHEGRGQPRKRWPRRNMIFFVTLGIIASCFGIAAFFLGNEYYRPVENDIYLASLPYSATLFFAVMAAIFFIVKGTTQSHKVFFAALAAFVLAIILGTMGGMVIFNGHYDQSESVTRLVPISGKYYKSHKNSQTYYASFQSWTKPGESTDIRVDQHLYKAFNPGAYAEIKTKAGRLHYEWLFFIRTGQAPPDKDHP